MVETGSAKERRRRKLRRIQSSPLFDFKYQAPGEEVNLSKFESPENMLKLVTVQSAVRRWLARRKASKRREQRSKRYKWALELLESEKK